MDFCGVQVGRGVAADEVANDGRNMQGANQNNSNVCQCDNLIFMADKPIYLGVLLKRSRGHGRKIDNMGKRRCSRIWPRLSPNGERKRLPCCQAFSKWTESYHTTICIRVVVDETDKHYQDIAAEDEIE